MLTLQTLRLIEKCVPCTEPETSKKGIYEITDNYYSMLGLELSCEEILENVNDYMGPVFEKICEQYLNQVSEYDCGPTYMLNAIIYLFNRDEIPPEVIRNTMLYCLDCYSKEGIPGKRGTSRAAV